MILQDLYLAHNLLKITTGLIITNTTFQKIPCETINQPIFKHYLATYIIGDVVIKLLRDEVIQTQNPYAILIPY